MLAIDLRNGVIEGYEGTGHHSDVHHVPEVPHESARVEDKALIQNLPKTGKKCVLILYLYEVKYINPKNLFFLCMHEVFVRWF